MKGYLMEHFQLFAWNELFFNHSDAYIIT